VDAARDIVQEALISGALEKAAGNRTVAAAALGIPDERVADALRRYPWLAKRWPAKRGRPPKGAL
jgi:transcriptional regulator with AAA-type ATPase domain